MLSDRTSPSATPSLTVAVVVATHQGERHLAEQLESLTRQSLPPTSVIISDAGSHDRTLQIAEEFADAAPFPVLIRRQVEPSDPAENLLSAALLATTDLVALCGQADVWLPEKLSESTRPFARAEVVLCAHAALLIDARRRVRGRLTQSIARSGTLPPRALDPWGDFIGSSMTFRRTLLDVIAPERRGADPDRPERSLTAERWIYFLASCFGEASLITEPLVLHRDSPPPGRPAKLRALVLRVRTVLARQRSLAERSARRRDVARARAKLLVEAADNPCLRSDERARLRDAARHWTRTARSEENRLALYRESGLEGRFEQLLRNVADGTYRRVSDGSFRHREIARDLLSLWVPP